MNQTTGQWISALIIVLTGFACAPIYKASAATDHAGKKVITYSIRGEPPTLNSLRATDQDSFFVLGHVMEGLTRYDAKGKLSPGVASKWELTDQKAVFHLRKDARWSDGKPVTAKDFVFAWRKLVDPKTGSQYAFVLFPLKNGEAISKGSVPPEQLGVEAKDDHTLVVQFDKPCGYFLSLTALASLFPVREDFYTEQGDKFAADAGRMLFNGPFVLSHWVHGASLTLDRNLKYWNASQIKLDRLDIPHLTPDNSARFNFFKDRKLDVLISMNKDDLPKAQAEKMKLKSFADGYVWFMEFNFREGKATRNKNLRKAIQAVFPRETYIQKVVGIPGTQPAISLIPSWIPGRKATFRKEFPLPPQKADIAKGKAYLAAAVKELGLQQPPQLVWLTGDSPDAGREAEYFQNLFKTTLGIDLKIDRQIFKQRLAKMTAGEFDIVSRSWGPDFADPMTFAELKASWNENNRGRWKNEAYDQHIRAAQATSDATKRMAAMAEAEKVLIDEAAVIPTYEKTLMYAYSDRVQGVVRRQIGADPDFTMATVVEERQGRPTKSRE